MRKISVREAKGEFFKILGETDKTQVGVMTLAPGRDSGPEEVHEKSDQIVYIIEGKALVEINHQKEELSAGELVIIPAGSQHHLYNSGTTDLFFLTIYAPPEY